MAKPVILLAFANERQTEGVYLRNLPLELNQLKKILESVEDQEICEVEILPNATLDNLVAAFQREKYRDRIAVFHYSGHADSYELLLEEAQGKSTQVIHGEGLVPFLADQKSLQFIFINGCFSAKQAEDLVRNGIPAVIGTVQAVNDRVATELSISFYQALAQGAGLDQAWKEATYKIQAKEGTKDRSTYYAQLQTTGDAQTRDLAMREPDDRFPWEIYYKEGAEKVKYWNLPDAANDPYFGLPDLPPHYELPDQPYRFLERYTAKDAPIFFGRGSYIRDLYQRLGSQQSAPVIMLYGQSGVGKSSLLAAGVFPRLEKDYDIQYIRREPEKGLSVALHSALSPDDTFDLEKKNIVLEQLEGTIHSFEDMLHSAEGIAKSQLEGVIADLKKRRKEFEQQPDQLSDQLHERWLQLEQSSTKKGLIVILDQVEEAFTRPMANEANELEKFLEKTQSIFNQPDQRPLGKLVLAYRKEYDSELEKAFRQYNIPKEKIFLDKLDKQGIQEIVNGLTSSKKLKNKYRLEIEEGLPGLMADNLLQDKDSAIAPVLQITLTKLWQQQEDNDQRVFSIENYHHLQEEGILLSDFFKQQMAQIHIWEDLIQQKVESSGLALDLLHFHTTPLGTAESRSLDTLRKQYNHQSEVLEELILQFKKLYLLTDTGANQTGLAHDTLAPIVQKEIKDSDKPGQRALRIIQTKVIDYARNPDEVVIEPDDLALVEEGAGGMRMWVPKERELVEKSRAYRAEQERIRSLNRAIKTGLGIGIAIFAIIATLFWYRNWEESKISRLLTHALEATGENPTVGLRLVEAAYKMNPKRQNTIQVLNNIYSNNYFYQKELVQKAGINAMAVSTDDQFILTGGRDNLARLWRVDGKLVQVFEGHDAEILAVAISPNGQIFASAGRDKTIQLWDTTGQLIQSFSSNDRVNDIRFSLDNKHLVSAGSDNFVRLWDLQGDSSWVIGRHEDQVLTVDIWSDQIISGSRDGIIKSWRIGQENPDTVLQQHKDWVLRLRFAPNGEYFASTSRDKSAILWAPDFNHISILRGHQYRVNDVAFSPNGKYILTASDDKKTILWDNEGNLLKTFTGQSDFITAVSCNSEGEYFITASMDGTIKTWPIWIKEAHSFGYFQDAVSSMDISADGSQILIGIHADTRAEAMLAGRLPDPRPGRNAYLFNTNGDTLKILQGHRHGITSVVLSPNNQFALTGSNDGTAILWDLQVKEKIIPPLKVLDKHHPKRQVMSVAFSPDGQFLLTASADNSLILWNLQGDSLQHFKGHLDFVNTATFSPDGSEVLSGSFDGTVRRWNLQGEIIQIFSTAPHRISQVDYSPNGNLIAAATWGGYTKIWDTGGEEILHVRSTNKNNTGHPKVHAVRFSPDGKLFATTEGESLIRLIDLKGNVLQIIMEHEGQANDVLFGPNQQYIFAGLDDGSVKSFYSLPEFFRQKELASLTPLQEEKFGLRKTSLKDLLSVDSVELLRTFAYQLEATIKDQTDLEEEILIMHKVCKIYSKILEKSGEAFDQKEAALAFSEYGKLLLKAGRYKQSINAFERNNAYESGNDNTMAAYCLALYLNGQIQKATDQLKRLPETSLPSLKSDLDHYISTLKLNNKRPSILDDLFPDLENN